MTTYPHLDVFFRIPQYGLRSIQVETDLGNLDISENYSLTAQSRATLARIIHNLEENSLSRSWTLTGPYGSGKSYYSLFLMTLACPTQAAHSYTLSQLRQVDPILTNRVESVFHFQDSRGLLPVPITGFRASFFECLKYGFLRTIRALKPSKALTQLENELEVLTANTDSRTIIRWIKDFVSVATNDEYRFHGVLLVFDEMGKPLEYAATHSEVVDVYLLQEIAEFANRSGDSPFLFIGILHQGFERYAAALDQATQREWNKIQGRFEDIAFQEPPNQQTRLLAQSIETLFSRRNQEFYLPHTEMAEIAIESGWCPALMTEDEFKEICPMAFPFHPSTLVALPHIFRRLAQNERSIFAFLASFEPFGFQEFIHKSSSSDFLRLPDLFDYLAANFQAKLYSSNRARALTETLERLNTSIGLNQLQTDIVKSIGLLNWLSEGSTIQANDGLLTTALVSEIYPSHAIREAINDLKKQSVIVYRSFNKTYAIWQGSDVDLEERLEQGQKQISGAFSLAEALQRYLPPRPLIARRHSFETGTLRFFEVRYIDYSSRNQASLDMLPGASGLVLLCLAVNQPEVDAFSTWAEQLEFRSRENVLVGITKRSARLGELLFDLRCYHWIEENSPQLRDDAVARKELFLRINDIETIIQTELDRSISFHRLTASSNCLWKYQGKDLPIEPNAGISQILSMICKRLYPASPIIWNEMLNRRNLTSQSAAARRNLITAMLEKADQPLLGIEGYPPERSMYESFLRNGGLHRLGDDNSWYFTEPLANSNLNLLPAWQAIRAFVFADPPEPRSVEDLYKTLMAPPFGITEGVLPVLLCAFLVVNRDETTMYREGTLLVDPKVADWEVLLRRPELFAITGSQVTGARAAVVTRIARGYNVAPTAVSVVRELVRQMKFLPEYAWRTMEVSKEAVRLRAAIEHAHSPEKLIFTEIPEAISANPLSGEDADKAILDDFFVRLNQTLSELANATPKRRLKARDIFLEACGLPANLAGWETFINIAREMNGKVRNSNLSPLIKRAVEAEDSAAALDSVLGLIANRPMKSWSDLDVSRFPEQAKYLGELFLSERNGYLPGLKLTAREIQRSEEIAAELHEILGHYQDDPKVIWAAIVEILNHYHSDNPL